jgi:hypothetical protein
VEAGTSFDKTAVRSNANLSRPMPIQKDAILLVLVGILGDLAAFGLVGLFIGRPFSR